MPAKRRRRSKGRRGYTAIPFQASGSLGTLGNGTVLAVPLLPAAFSEDFYCLSVKAQLALHGVTTGEGPIGCGYAHDDLTVAEIAEKLDASLTDPDDIIARERARRPVRMAGSFPTIAIDEVLNDGVPVKTPIKFMIGDGHSLTGYVQNRSGTALTTGATVLFDGVMFGRWVR